MRQTARSHGVALMYSAVLLLPVLTLAQTAPEDEGAIIRRVLESAHASDKPATSATTKPAEKPEETSLDRLAEQLTRKGSPKQLVRLAHEFAAAVGSSNRRDIANAYKAIRRLRTSKAAVKAFESAYEEIPEGSIDRRLVMLQIIGEMQQPSSLTFLKSVAWKPLPPPEKGSAELTSRREYEEMIEAAAVEAIAYTRDEKNAPFEAAVAETLAVASGHPSHAVKLAAIDAYVWNYGNDAAALANLRRKLPPEYERYIEMPRFHRGKLRTTFEKDLAAWRQKWAKEEGVNVK